MKQGIGKRTASAIRAMRETSDERLVRLVRRGESAAFEALYERYARELLSFCTYVLGSREDAEDAVQATFTGAYRALLADERAVEVRPWLFTIARNAALTILRKRRPTVAIFERASREELVTQVEQRERVRQLLGAVLALPERQRTALVLAELHGHSHGEIAIVLGVSAEQVKAYVYQARSSLTAEVEARNADCATIRAELMTARGAQLLRGRLRRHLRSCAECSEFARVRADRRRAFGALLPVFPSAALQRRVLHATIGNGSSGGGACAGGGAAAGGTSAACGSSAAGGSSLASVAAELGGAGVKVLAAKALVVIAASAGAAAGTLTLADASTVPSGTASTALVKAANARSRVGDAAARVTRLGGLSTPRAGGHASAAARVAQAPVGREAHAGAASVTVTVAEATRPAGGDGDRGAEVGHGNGGHGAGDGTAGGNGNGNAGGNDNGNGQANGGSGNRHGNGNGGAGNANVHGGSGSHGNSGPHVKAIGHEGSGAHGNSGAHGGGGSNGAQGASGGSERGGGVANGHVVASPHPAAASPGPGSGGGGGSAGAESPHGNGAHGQGAEPQPEIAHGRPEAPAGEVEHGPERVSPGDEHAAEAHGDGHSGR